MSFRCPANYIEGKDKNIYNQLIDSYSIEYDNFKKIYTNIKEDDFKAMKNFFNNPSDFNSFLKTGVFPSSLEPDALTNETLESILVGLTRKITSCSTAYKSTESYTIISKLKKYFSTNNTTSNFIKILYLMSYLIVSYLGYNYITSKMFSKGSDNIPSFFGKYKIIYKFFIIIIPITMIALMISNKVNVSFNVSNVLLYFSISLIVLIGVVKTIASKNSLVFIILISLVFGCSFLSGSGMYYWSGESDEDKNDDRESEKSDSWQISIVPIIVISFIMILLIYSIGKSATIGKNIAILIIIGFIISAFTLTFSKSNYRDKRAFFYFLGILVPFLLFFVTKWQIYNSSGVNSDTSLSVAVYVGLKIAILSGLLSLGIYKMYKASAEIERAKKTETTISQSPYYPITRPINALMYVYYILLGLIGIIILVVIFSQIGLLFKLNGLQGLKNQLRVPAITAPQRTKIQNEINSIENGKAWPFVGIDFSYIMAVIIVMSLVISYNGTFSIWLPFFLIPIGLLERGVVTTIMNIFNNNISKQVEDWQPVGSYFTEGLINLFTYTPLSDKAANNSGEKKVYFSFLDKISELNSTMFNAN
jgi:uncharacterized Tic20 family protein